MGALSKLGGCLSSFGSVLTNRRTRLRFVVGLTAVLEITTAALAAQEGAKLQKLVNFMENEGGKTSSDPEVMGYTLLVCNCAAEVAFVVMHILYSIYFVFMRSCCGWCRSASVSTMFGMLTTMTFYTSVLSLALAGPLQIYDKKFSNFPDVTYTATGFTWTNATDYPLYVTTYALFYASGSCLFVLWGVLLLSRSLLVSDADDEEAARQDARPAKPRQQQQQQQPDGDEEAGSDGGFFGRFRGGKGSETPTVPMQPMEAPRQAAMSNPMRSAENPLFGGGAPSLPSKPSSGGGYGGGGGGDGGNPFEGGGGGGGASSNPWGAPSGGGSPWGEAARGAQLYEMSRK